MVLWVFQPYRNLLRPEQKILVCPLPRFSSQLLIFCWFVLFSFISFSLTYFVYIVNPVKIKKLKLIQNYHPLHGLHSKVVMYLLLLSHFSRVRLCATPWMAAHCPWDSPGKNTGVGCHFLLQCMKVKSETEVAQSCLTLCNPMDCSLPGSSVH